MIGLAAIEDPEVEFVMVFLAGHSNLCRTCVTKLLILKPCGSIRIRAALTQPNETIKLDNAFTNSLGPSCELKALMNFKKTCHFAVLNACFARHPSFLFCKSCSAHSPDPKSDLCHITSHPITFVFPQRRLWLEKRLRFHFMTWFDAIWHGRG